MNYCEKASELPTFTASREDFMVYLSCPKKLALKTMGVRVKEVHQRTTVAPAHAIGRSGEKLTEEILEIIASIQADDKSEYVERISSSEVPEELLASELRFIEMAKTLMNSSQTLEELLTREESEEMVRMLTEFSVKDSFKRYEAEAVLEYKNRVLNEQRERVGEILGGLIQLLPKIEAVYKPLLINSDTCSRGLPDFQCDTVEGPILLEVKNLAELPRALKEGEVNLTYYTSLLMDDELGRSECNFLLETMTLPKPVKSILVIPRHGKVIDIPPGDYWHFREIAVEIWKIKRAAIVEGKLPDVRMVPSMCKRCAYKKHCKEGESLEATKPLPLVYAVASDEAEDELSKLKPCFYPLPQGFWEAYNRLMRMNDQEKLSLMREYLITRWREAMERESIERSNIIYRSMPNEFDSWGGLEFLKTIEPKIRRTSSLFYGGGFNRKKEILRIAKKRWEI